MIFKKKQPLSSLSDGDRVDDIFVVKIKKAMAPYAKGFSFDLILSDSSGRTMDYKYWGGGDEAKVKALFDTVKADSVVHVQGKVSTFNNRLQLTTNEPFMIEVLQPGQYDESEFIRPAKRDVEEMYRQVLDAIAEVKDAKMKQLLDNVFKEIGGKFKVHPGAIEIHHNWKGGLMQHTLEMLDYCRLSAKMFNLDNDLLTTGCLLHDIGKLDEIEVTSRIKGTTKGQLIGHLTMSVIKASAEMDKLGMDELMKQKILHMVVSHHGRNEYGSPKEPMFPEALALYYADEASSKISEMSEFITSAKSQTEDDFMYHRRHERNILLK